MEIERVVLSNGHTRRLLVTPLSQGWEVREEEDSIVVRCVRHDDWHRVERDVHLFDVAAAIVLREEPVAAA